MQAFRSRAGRPTRRLNAGNIKRKSDKIRAAWPALWRRHPPSSALSYTAGMAPIGRLALPQVGSAPRSLRAGILRAGILRASVLRASVLRAGALFVLAVSLLAIGCQRKPEPGQAAGAKSGELPKLGVVGAFSLIDQGGATVSAESLRHKVWVAAFFFTRCPTICPRITRRMRALQLATGAMRPPLTLCSFSVDPENDTPPVLLAYAKRFDADLQSWSFLTGDLATVKRTVVDGFKLALDGKPDPAAENGGIIHGSHLVLVDRELTVRGYYRTDDDDAMKQLAEDAARL